MTTKIYKNIAIVAISLLGITNTVEAQNVCLGENRNFPTYQCSLSNPQVNYVDIVKEATKLSIMELLVVSNLPRTYSRSCEERVFGCEAHIESVVDLFFEQQNRRGIDPLILAAMAKHETNFNPFAVNDVYGAAGLLQLLPSNRHAKGVRFIHSRAYREQCRNDYYACQGEVVEASVTLLERSIRRCDNDLRQGLGMYGSGSCRGSRRFSKYVIRLAGELRIRQRHYIEILSNRYNHNICEADINQS